MAGEYDINLSNGTVLTTLHPNEINGPDNISAPQRQISQINPTFNIIQIGAISPNGIIKLSNDVASYFPVGANITIAGSPGGANDGQYTVSPNVVPGSPSIPGSWFDSNQNETNIILIETLSFSGAGGSATLADTVIVSGDITYRMIPGQTFNIQNSGANDGTYTVSGFGSYVANGNTVIPTTTPLSMPTSQLGGLSYTINDARTSLKLPGKGTINYGEMLIENAVRMLEHFAADQPPELNNSIGTSPAAQPIVGQLWYNTTAGEEGFKHYDGSQWTSDVDVDSGSIVFRDAENSNSDIHVLASESAIPGTPKPGLVIWPELDSPDGEPIFRVLSNAGEERLRVDYHSTPNAGYLSTVNNIRVLGSGDSEIVGQLSIGGSDSIPSATRALNVGGTGLSVSSTTGNNANVSLDAPINQASIVQFNVNSVTEGELFVNGSVSGQPLEINTTVSNNVSIAKGLGYVGLRTDPSFPLHVSGDAKFNNRVGINQDPPVANVPIGTDIHLAVTGDIQANSQFLASDGASTEPTYSFTSDTDTGMYLGSPNQLSFAVTGTTIAELSSSSLTILNSAQIIAPAGNPAAPTYTFDSDTDTGMYSPANDRINIALGGSDVVLLDSSQSSFSSNVRINNTNAEVIINEDSGTGDPRVVLSSNGDFQTILMFDDSSNTTFLQNLTAPTATPNANLMLSNGAAEFDVPLTIPTVPTDPAHAASKHYVDGISWREPVTVRSQTSYADSSAFPTSGLIDGEPLVVGMRVLFSDVTTISDRDIWYWDGTNWNKNASNAQTIGDATYVQYGTDFGQAYAFNKDNEWALITGSGGGGGTFFQIEKHVATSGQTTFNLTNAYKPSATGDRLMVFVDGVKYIKGVGYTEVSSTQVALLPATPLVGGEEVEFYVLTETASDTSLKREQQTSLVGNPSITFATITYVVGSDGLMVYVNGQKVVNGIDYNETSSTTIDWIGDPLIGTDVLEFYSGVPVVAGTQLIDIDDVSSIPPQHGYVLTYNNISGAWEPQANISEDGVSIDELQDGVSGNGPTVFNTAAVNTIPKTGTQAHIQVFVNGVLQREGATASFVVTGPNQISFNSAVPTSAEVTIYQL